MRERLKVCTIAVLMLTMTATAGTLARPAPAAPGVVEIDAETGELSTLPARPGTNVTIRVTNVTPSSGGFDLQGPKETAFLNQSSRHDGVVEFWDTPVLPGTYNVTRKTSDGERTVVSDVEIVNPGVTAASGCGWWGDCRMDCTGSARTEKVEEARRWSPMLIVNSPSGGKAEATTTTDEVESMFFAPARWTSSNAISSTITAEDGESRGLFQKATWGIYQRSGYCAGNTKTAKVIDWRPGGEKWVTAENLTGPDRYTDADNVRKLESVGIPSVEFDATYKDRDQYRSDPHSATTTGSTISGIWGEISIDFHAVTFDLIQFSSTTEDEEAYRYEFNEYGSWSIDEIEDGPGWAFCRPTKTEC